MISPSRRYLFRDSGLPVDELCRSIVRAAPDHLVDGGHCQLLASWAHVAGEDWHDRLASWFEGTGCDASCWSERRSNPAAHAASWLRQTEAPERWRDDFDEWMSVQRGAPYRGDRVRTDHDAQAGGRLDLVPRRRGTAGHRDAVRGSSRRRVRARRLPRTTSTTTHLLATALTVAPDVVLDERARPNVRRWVVTERRLRQTAALCHQGDVDPASSAIVAGVRRTAPLGDVLAEIADAAGVSIAEHGRGGPPDHSAADRAGVPATGRDLSRTQSFLFDLEIPAGRHRRLGLAGRRLRRVAPFDLAEVQRELLDRRVALASRPGCGW